MAVDTVDPCSRLSTRGEGSGALPGLVLSCLTEPGSVDVSRLGGTPTLVNLWASWCGPCRAEMPVLQAAYERVKGRVQFVGVDTRDDPAAAADYLPEVGVTYPQLVDIDGRLLEHTRIPGLPVTLLLDEDGVEVARHVGPLTMAELEDLLDQALTRRSPCVGDLAGLSAAIVFVAFMGVRFVVDEGPGHQVRR